VFPRWLGADYTGCQTMWDEKGTPLMLLRFERGALASCQEFSKQKVGVQCLDIAIES
jgi:hypothetical protein